MILANVYRDSNFENMTTLLGLHQCPGCIIRCAQWLTVTYVTYDMSKR